MCKQKLPNFYYFYWNLGNRLTYIIFHTRRPNTYEKVSYLFDFHVSAVVNFFFFFELNSTFFTSLPFGPPVMNNRDSCVWRSVIAYRTEINQKPHFRVVENLNMPIVITVIHIQFNVSEFIMNPSLNGFSEYNDVASRNKGKTIILVRSLFQYANWKYWFHNQCKRSLI
jgi:hypothetical protein